LSKWLSQKKGWRLATEADCDCAEDIARMKQGFDGPWKAVPDYQPYYAAGDFNSDGIEDFAVALIDPGRATKQFAVAIFNGPFIEGKPQPEALFSDGFELVGCGFVFGPPRPKPYRLVVGRFESDNALLFAPRGNGYIIK